MRILVVSNLYPPTALGGYEVECSGVVAHLRSQGHEVAVLTSTEGEPAPDETGIHRVLPFARHRPQDSLCAPLDAMRGARVARRVLEAEPPDLVYVFNGAGLPYVLLRALALSGRPMAVRVCEHWFGGVYAADRFLRHLPPGDRGLRGLWARLLRFVDRADPALRTDLETVTRVAISWNAEFMRGAVPVSPLFDVVHEDVLLPVNPRVPRFATVERREPPAGQAPVIFFAGRLDAYKGAGVAVRALALLRDEHGLEARLVLAGAGTDGERTALQALAGELGLTAQVELPGPLDFAAMSSHLATAAAWVIPSVWDEPAPTVALEAALSGVPAVLSRVGGIPEVLREEREALLFARGDAAGCAAALHRTLTGGAETAARVLAARERAAELSYEHYLARTDEFLSAAMAALAPPAVTVR